MTKALLSHRAGEPARPTYAHEESSHDHNFGISQRSAGIDAFD